MPIFSCRVCGREAYVKPSHAKNGWGIYCSKVCNYKGQMTGRFFNCYTCGRKTYKSLKSQLGSKSGKFFCSKSCQTLWRNSVYVGSNHGNWRGGNSSYRATLLRAGVLPACKRCQSRDERTLTAHHKDGNRRNNSLTNLIWLCHNCHYLVHHYKSETKDFMVPVAQFG